MAKLTKVQRRQIATALHHIQRAHAYIFSDKIAVARKETFKGIAPTTTLHYTRADGLALYEVEKEYGSDLCGLQDARKALQGILFA